MTSSNHATPNVKIDRGQIADPVHTKGPDWLKGSQGLMRSQSDRDAAMGELSLIDVLVLSTMAATVMPLWVCPVVCS